MSTVDYKIRFNTDEPKQVAILNMKLIFLPDV